MGLVGDVIDLHPHIAVRRVMGGDQDMILGHAQIVDALGEEGDHGGRHVAGRGADGDGAVAMFLIIGNEGIEPGLVGGRKCRIAGE